MTRCSKCSYFVSEALPKITKKIVYLDQLVLSNMLTAKEPRWKELLERLRLLAYLQVITCPFSTIHEDESLLAETSRNDLKELYRELSDGNEFCSPAGIEQNQLLDAIRRHLLGVGGIAQWEKPRPWTEFAVRDPHAWTEDLAAYADFPLDPGRLQHVKLAKERLHADLGAVANTWKSEPTQFEEDVEREASSYGKGRIEMYQELAGGLKRIEAISPPETPDAGKTTHDPRRFDPHTPPGIQPGVKLIHRLAAEVHYTHPDDTDPVAVVERFLQTKPAMEVPFLYISSRLWATIAQRVRNPKGPREPKSSDSYDVSAISHYAPYCDAMVVDSEFYAMATQGNIDVPAKFGVRLFRARELDDFMDYLGELVAIIPDEHRLALEQVLPHLSALSL
jgi:hypothetical protein